MPLTVRLLFVVGLAFSTSCAPPTKACSSATCALGCCTTDGRCDPGNSQDSCGRGGTSCVSCSLGSICSLGGCTNPSGVGGGTSAGGGTVAGGGSVAGGSSAGGSAAGGSVAGGSVMSGGTAGGNAGGSVTSGGTATAGGLATGGGLVAGGGSSAGGTAGGLSAGGSAGGGTGGCGPAMPGTPPFPRRCAGAATNECAGAVDTFLSSNGVPTGRLNGTQGNGFDDDCDGVVDEGCACSNAGMTKDCWLVPATQADATSQPVGWCRAFAKGTVECVGGSASEWSGVCRGALPAQAADTCAPGDFDCDGLASNNPNQGCACGAPVACPTAPLSLAPYPTPTSLRAIDGTQWITDPAQRSLAQNWTWTVVGGDCDNVLPFPTFALYSQAASSSTSRLGARTAVRFDSAATPPRYVAATGAPTASIQVARGTSSTAGIVYPAFGLSGDYLVQGEFTLNGTLYSCSQRVEVRAPGLRAELCWDSVGGNGGSSGTDLDLHLARLQNTCTTPQGWNLLCQLTGSQDCYYDPNSGCRETSTAGPRWGYVDSVSTACLGWSSRRTTGAQGCTNPRLDRDNITCDRSIADPTSSTFCGPENINLDTPNDLDGFVIGVNHYGATAGGTSAKPHVNLYCNGRRVLSSGFNPASAEQWPLLRTPGADMNGDFWTVATVRAHVSGGQLTSCDVTPIPSRHADPTRDGPVAVPGAGNGFCVDSTMNQTPAPYQFSSISRRFIDTLAQGADAGTRPQQAQQWCKH